MAYEGIFDVPMANRTLATGIQADDDVDNDAQEVVTDLEQFCDEMDQELATTHMDGGLSALDVATQATDATNKCIFPKISLEGNEWLATLLASTPRATLQEVMAAFPDPGMETMKSFWSAELGAGEGHCGGGIVLLAARAFQQVKESQLDRHRFPSFEEALWQFFNLVQYQSMNDKQRIRQSRINTMLVGNLPADSLFLKRTFIPLPEQLGRYYGATGQHSMFNNLPCPKAVDIDGVAYVSPKLIVAFCLANGIPIDDVHVAENTNIEAFSATQTVNHACQSRKSVQWINTIKTGYYGRAPNSKGGAPRSPVVICVGVSDWTDGFGPGKVKNNRTAVDCKSFTVSPPKHLVNGTANTFPVAMGLKNAKGWRQVERLFRQDIESLTGATEPAMFYHGRSQKILPCFFKRMVVMSDKAERNGLTGTIGCGSDTHRCFSVSGIVSTPSCRLDGLTNFLKRQQQNKHRAAYGWSETFISSEGGTNGAVFPSCRNCRRANLEQLGMRFGKAKKRKGSDGATKACTTCCDWELLPQNKMKASLLDFPAPSDYPSTITEGCPVDPPAGRDKFGDEIELPVIQLSWDVMKKGCRFAFYQASRPRKGWTKASTLSYLRFCGISKTLAEELYSAAKECCKEGTQENISFTDPTGVGKFQFPAPWLSTEISLRDYIEAVMHQLFLGIAESNFELMQLWLKELPASSKLGLSPFKNVLQTLIKDLRPFMLSWLEAYPLTGKKGNLGTGSWVGENHICFVRISQPVFGWCCRNAEENSKHGVDDMSRMVISFHALVARCLTHGGINDAFIQETERLMKEFLSSVREFDVRVRHKVLNSKSGKKKGTEAWWLKPNYMSLSNLLAMMFILGPLVEYWDGGGKGERFIQVVKPHIKRGVRDDLDSFFVNLMDKIYRGLQLDLLEILYGVAPGGKLNDFDLMDILRGMVEVVQEEDTTTQDDDESDDEEDDVCANDVDDDACFSTSETQGMAKKRTIYVYRKKEHLVEAFSKKKPIAGYVEVTQRDGGEPIFEFQAVYRKPVKQFARQKIAFDDPTGVSFHGMWWAPIRMDPENVRCTDSFTNIQADAKLAAVAIPLWYMIGKEHPNSYKYCVITNWWKYRMSDGWYRLPGLDENLYDAEYSPTNKDYNDNANSDDTPAVATRIVNGIQVGEI